MKAKLFVCIPILIMSLTSFAKGNAKENRQQFLSTCMSAYQDLAKTNLKKPKASTQKAAQDRCNMAARPTDDMDGWDIMDDKKLGCDIGVRSFLKDYPKMGNANNESDWKKYYGAVCGNWGG